MAWAKPMTWPQRREMLFGDRVVTCYGERPANLDALIRETIERFPDRQAYVAGARSLTYAELDRQLDRVAANLAARGVGAGDRVGVLCGNGLEFILAAFGAVRRGAIAVPIGTRQAKAEIDYIIGNSGMTALVFDADLADRLPANRPPAALCFAVDGPAPEAQPFADLLADGPQFVPPVIAGEDTAFIMYTSGTTGRPKGAMLAHVNFVHSTMHFQTCVGHTENTRALLAIPASHISGLGAIVTTMLRVGGCTVFMREFKARPCLELMARERITFTVFVPTMYKLCLMDPEFDRFELHRHWTVGLYGGAIMPPAIVGELAAKLPALELVNGYGATETTSPATVTPYGEARDFPETIGMTVPCGDIRIMDDDGREVPRGTAGELWIAGPMIVRGYWNNPEATASGFAGGYWKSGDIGSMDENGRIRILDRKKDMINRAGYKVYSAEVENVLSFHPDVVECVVVPRPDPVLGERVQAFVHSRNPALSDRDLKGFCVDRLADYKVPDVFVLQAEPLPRNNNGKVMKAMLRDEVRRAVEAAG